MSLADMSTSKGELAARSGAGPFGVERVYFVSRYAQPGQANGSNPHIRAVEVVSVAALIVMALGQLAHIFPVP